MNIRKYLFLTASGGLTLLLSLVAVFFLIKYASHHQAVTANLQTASAKLDALKRRNPFPSVENVQLATTNLAQLTEKFNEFMKALARDQYQARRMEPAQFPLLLQKTLTGLNTAAETNSVAVPDLFAYGFDRYAKSLPIKEDLPRLARQLHGLDQVCRVLFAAPIHDLTGVERHVFEDSPAAGAAPGAVPGDRVMRRIESASGGGSADAAAGYYEEPSGLFVRERMIFTFTAKESALWQILNNLPRLQAFCVVAGIDIVNPTPKPVRVTADAAGAAAAAAAVGTVPHGPGPRAVVPENTPMAPVVLAAGGTNAPAFVPKRDQRVVAGRLETEQVKMKVDFYYFKQPGDTGDKKESKP